MTESYYNEKPTMKLISPILRTVWTERLLGQMRSLFRKGLCTYDICITVIITLMNLNHTTKKPLYYSLSLYFGGKLNEDVTCA